MATNKQRIVPFLWFNDNAEEAVNFYVSLFNDSKILSEARYPEGSPGPVGSIMTMSFQLEGQEFMALNGGPHFKFTEAISLYVKCETQEEIDALWDKFSEGGQIQQCGWLKDRFGLSWQIVPPVLGKLLQDKDRNKAQKVMQAMMKMKKIDIRQLEEAYNS